MITDNFNKTLITLLEQLFQITNEKKFRKYHILITNMLEDDNQKNKLIEQFIVNVLVHKDGIMKKDETVFTNINISSESHYTNDIYNLRDIFVILSVENKNIVFDYLITLTHYAEKYFQSYVKA